MYNERITNKYILTPAHTHTLNKKDYTHVRTATFASIEHVLNALEFAHRETHCRRYETTAGARARDVMP